MGVGDVNLIAKIAPKNDAFTVIVDAANSGADTSNFDNNLSAADTTVQAALETLDDLSIQTQVTADDTLLPIGSQAGGDTGLKRNSGTNQIEIWVDGVLRGAF